MINDDKCMMTRGKERERETGTSGGICVHAVWISRNISRRRVGELDCDGQLSFFFRECVVRRFLRRARLLRFSRLSCVRCVSCLHESGRTTFCPGETALVKLRVSHTGAKSSRVFEVSSLARLPRVPFAPCGKRHALLSARTVECGNGNAKHSNRVLANLTGYSRALASTSENARDYL